MKATVINASTKRGRAFINAYENSRNYSLADCYGRYSCKKAIAENACRLWMRDEAGYDFRILSYNTFGFTCGWRTDYGLRVETPGGSYLVA